MNLRRVAATVRAIPVVRKVVPVANRVLRRAKHLPVIGPTVVRWTRPAPRPAVRVAPVPATPPPPAPPVVANLRACRWVDPGVLELQGWAYLADSGSEGVEIGVVAESPAGQRLAFTVDQTPVDEANLVAKDPERDRRDAAFTARLDLAHESRAFPEVNFEQTWTVRVVLRGSVPGGAGPGPELARSGFTTYFKLGSAQLSQAENVGADLLVRPLWRREPGLVLVVARRAAVLTAITLIDGRLRFSVGTRRFAVATAVVKQEPAAPIVLPPLEPAADGRSEDRGTASGPETERTADEPAEASFEADLAQLELEPGASAYLVVANAGGSTRHVHWSGSNRSTVLTDPTLPDLRVICSPSGVVRIDRVVRRLEVTGADLDASGEVPVLVLTGRVVGLTGMDLQLRGPRDVIAPTRTDLDDDRPLTGFVARFPLAVQHPWQQRVNAIRQGVYRLAATSTGTDAPTEAVVATELGESLAIRLHLDSVNVRLERSTGGLFQARVEPPKDDAEHGAVNQARHVAAFRAPGHRVVDCVYYESFNGRSVGDNTLAVAAELTRRRPELPAYWAVADGSVEIPEGTTPLLIHSAAWWDLLASARYVVSNNWLAGASVRRPYQTVMQTWHGTPLKTLGIDRFEADDPEKVARMREMSSIWDMLLSQNPYSTEVFRRCYVYDGPVLEIGYPRNDVLTSGLPADRLSALRAELGVAEGQKVVLYMPTWREDTRQLFVGLDYRRLVAGIGTDWTVLVRGHTNTQKHGRTLAADGVVDVTMYPDPAALYLLADVLITDYSSVMFDYSITGKPILFFTPDLERYESSLRGTYFSLPRKAPGPMLTTTDDVVAALRDLDGVAASHAGRYAKWRAEFNPWDDGEAARRAVDVLLAHQPPG